LVVRIARAHGFQRSAERIQATVLKVLGRKYRKTQDDGRMVIWDEASNISGIVSYRESNSEVRLHVDIPVAELAGLAVPFIRVRLTSHISPLLAERNQFHDARSVPTDEQALQKCRSAR
jgi:hypothetical protein